MTAYCQFALVITAVLCVSVILGCGQAGFSPTSDQARFEQAAMAVDSFHDSNKRLPDLETQEQLLQGDVPTPRKIIYTAQIQLVVDQFDGLEQRINNLINSFGGYVSSADLDRLQGERRSGRWVARIPVAAFDDFLEAVAKLGVPTSRHQNAQDVTEEFVDIEARLGNKRKLEERILQLLDRPDDEIKHVIEVERELARVREEIERMEGRLRFLTDQTEMTTVTISAREERDYVPPEAPTLGKRISSAWQNSLHNTTTFLQNTVVFIVGNFIGFVLFLVAVCVGFYLLRKTWRFFWKRTATSAN